MRATVAAASNGGTAVEDELNGEVDVITAGVAGDLDAVSEGAGSAVSPARSTVLGNVLVEGLGDV